MSQTTLETDKQAVRDLLNEVLSKADLETDADGVPTLAAISTFLRSDECNEQMMPVRCLTRCAKAARMGKSSVSVDLDETENFTEEQILTALARLLYRKLNPEIDFSLSDLLDLDVYVATDHVFIEDVENAAYAVVGHSDDDDLSVWKL
jgi:hypothetical protein